MSISFREKNPVKGEGEQINFEDRTEITQQFELNEQTFYEAFQIKFCITSKLTKCMQNNIPTVYISEI
jgi:hypothetical protein